MKSKPSAHVAANGYEINMFNACKKRIITTPFKTHLHDKALHSPTSSMTSWLFCHLLPDIFCYSMTHSVIVLSYHCSLYHCYFMYITQDRPSRGLILFF